MQAPPPLFSAESYAAQKANCERQLLKEVGAKATVRTHRIGLNTWLACLAKSYPGAPQKLRTVFDRLPNETFSLIIGWLDRENDHAHGRMTRAEANRLVHGRKKEAEAWGREKTDIAVDWLLSAIERHAKVEGIVEGGLTKPNGHQDLTSKVNSRFNDAQKQRAQMFGAGVDLDMLSGQLTSLGYDVARNVGNYSLRIRWGDEEDGAD